MAISRMKTITCNNCGAEISRKRIYRNGIIVWPPRNPQNSLPCPNCGRRSFSIGKSEIRRYDIRKSEIEKSDIIQNESTYINWKIVGAVLAYIVFEVARSANG